MSQVLQPKPKKRTAAAKPNTTAKTLVFKRSQGKPITDSLKVAAGFEKTHKSVLRAISLLECDDVFRKKNFAAWSYTDGRGKKQPTVLLTEDGFTFLITAFTGKRAAKFKQDYIAQFNEMRDELVNLNRPMSLEEHTDRSTQLSNSKAANRLNFLAGGISEGIGYHRQNCLLHTGKQPKVIVQEAKDAGIPSKYRGSAKEVLRLTQPATACAISMADQLRTRGIALKDAAAITVQAIPIFSALLNLGIGAAALDPEVKRLQ